MPPDAMLLFLRALRLWAPFIARSTYCSNIEFEAAKHGEFTLTARWKETKAVPSGSHSIYFSRSRVLGRSASKAPLHQRPVKKVCAFRDDDNRELLQQRGIV